MKQQKLTRALSIACTIAGLSFSASALGQTSDSATYEATAPAYAVVLDNGLADSSATVAYNNTALDNQSRITDMIAVVEDQDVKVRANSAYSLALVIPTFPYDIASCVFARSCQKPYRHHTSQIDNNSCPGEVVT